MKFLRVVWAFLARDFQTELSYRLSFLMQFGGLFFSTTFWYFMASVIHFGDPAKMAVATGGLGYFEWVLGGLMVSRFLDVSMHVYATTIRTEQTTGTLEAMLVTPTGIGHIVLASSAWSYLFAALQAGLYLAIGVLLFDVKLHVGSIAGLLAALFFTAVGMSGIGILSAAFVLYFKRGNPVDYLISTLNTLFGNVIIPVAVLPAQVRVLSNLLPTSDAAEAVRGALFRGESLATVAPHLYSLAVFAGILVPVGLLGAVIAVRRAKREGSLVQY